MIKMPIGHLMTVKNYEYKTKKPRRGSFFVQCTKECDLPFMKKLLSGMTIHKKKL